MPSASDELCILMNARFGSLDDAGPIKFLEDAGYKLTRKHEWIPKIGVKSLDDMSQDEFDCLLFLCHEWDMDGLVAPDEQTTM